MKMKLSKQTLALSLAAIVLLSVLVWQCYTSLTLSRREKHFLPAIEDAAARYHVPVALVLAVIKTESDFEEDAVSPAGATGLMQLLPDTFRYLRDEKLSETLADEDVCLPHVNIRYGTYYLSCLYARFGNWPTTIAAYNAGETRVAEWLENPSLAKDGALTFIPFEETREYVEKVLKEYRYYASKYMLKRSSS